MLDAKPDDPILDVADVSVTYATSSGLVTAVDHVNISLGRGEFLGIVGESG